MLRRKAKIIKRNQKHILHENTQSYLVDEYYLRGIWKKKNFETNIWFLLLTLTNTKIENMAITILGTFIQKFRKNKDDKMTLKGPKPPTIRCLVCFKKKKVLYTTTITSHTTKIDQESWILQPKMAIDQQLTAVIVALVVVVVSIIIYFVFGRSRTRNNTIQLLGTCGVGKTLIFEQVKHKKGITFPTKH